MKYTKRLLKNLKTFCRESILNRQILNVMYSRDKKSEARDGIEEKMQNQLRYFKELTLSEVMIPRHNIISVSHSISFNDLHKAFIKHSLTRIPVYQDSPDNIIGFIHVKDLLPYTIDSDDITVKQNFNINSIIRKLIYSHRFVNCLDLLTTMQHKAIQIAVILDEHGAADGLVMMELLLEEIIGDIRDEHDLEKPQPILISKITDHEYTIQAHASIEEIAEAIEGHDFSSLKGEYETLGGFIMSYLNRMPYEGEEVIHPISGLKFEIISANSRKINTILLKLPTAG